MGTLHITTKGKKSLNLVYKQNQANSKVSLKETLDLSNFRPRIFQGKTAGAKNHELASDQKKHAK